MRHLSILLFVAGCADIDLPTTTGDGDADTFERLSNSREVCGDFNLVPAANEEGHLCAARLTPSAYPFEVTRIRYVLAHGPASTVTCNAALEHQVQLFANVDSSPPAEPTLLAQLTIPAEDPATISGEGRTVSTDLPDPVTLHAQEHLFVAIKFAGTYPDVMCVGVNSEDPYEANRNYWSNAAAPPYAWAELESFDLDGSILISASGYIR